MSSYDYSSTLPALVSYFEGEHTEEEHWILDPLRDLFHPTNNITAADAARKMDDIYLNYFDFKFERNERMGGFLWTLWELVFEISTIIPYNDDQQDLLINFIHELRKLPPKPFKIWDVSFACSNSLCLLISFIGGLFGLFE